MWTCLNCQRNFKTKNQSHSCVRTEVDDLFINTPPVVRDIYDELFRRCSRFCEIRTDTTKSCIYFMDTHRYLALKPRSTGLILEFILNRKEDIFPVINIFNINKHQVVHRMKLDSVADISDQIIEWIREAYQLKQSK